MLGAIVFNGQADKALDRGAHAVQERIAAEGVRVVRRFFAESIRHEHGRFLATIKTIESSRVFVTVNGGKAYVMPIIEDRATDTLVTSDLASYGPWLEGTGSRNETTRFKGYHGFRRSVAVLNDMAVHLADEALVPYIKECQ